MKIVRYHSKDNRVCWGSRQENGEVVRLSGSIESGFSPTSEVDHPAAFLPPVEPPAIYCIGANYRHHIEECGMPIPEQPVVFMKGPNALQAHEAPIRIPKVCLPEEVDYEGELTVVIGKTCRNVSRENALDHVLGYACANDVSARNWQIKLGGGQWCRGKGFDTFLPIGPWVVTTDEIPDPSLLHLKTTLNGVVKQDWPTGDMVFDVPAIIEFLSSDTTLLPGTVILTGTPHGVGAALKPPVWLHPGDRIEIEITGIGCLSNPVLAAE